MLIAQKYICQLVKDTSILINMNCLGQLNLQIIIKNLNILSINFPDMYLITFS